MKTLSEFQVTSSNDIRRGLMSAYTVTFGVEKTTEHGRVGRINLLITHAMIQTQSAKIFFYFTIGQGMQHSVKIFIQTFGLKRFLVREIQSLQDITL